MKESVNNPRQVCRHLRAKKMFIPALAQESPGGEEVEMGHSGHCWCSCSLTETGPDDRPVGFDHCLPGRSCYEE